MEMFSKTLLRSVAGILTSVSLTTAATIKIDATAQKHPISPYIYGKNHGISDNPDKPTADSIIRLYKDCGVKMLRLGGGNNQTKYNWKSKLSSHPDWFNNVYAHDWDFQAREVQEKLPGVNGLFSFQLLGWVADNTKNNWNDWQWKQDHNGTYPPRTFNLAGGGSVSTDGSTLVTEGDPSLYLRRWPADSTVGILDHWFGTDGIGLDKKRFQYWNMDNEPDIWSGTHGDVMKDSVPWETFISNYIAVAKAARAKYPGIKLVGPVTTNEWQWYNWNGGLLSVDENGTTKKYLWLEHFVKQLAEEQKSSRLRLLDVFDFHFYPGMNSDTNIHDITQLHRIWFDTTYNYPKANGVKKIGPKGWNPDTTKEFIMLRVRRWLNQYMGPDNGVTFSVSECGAIYPDNASVNAVWYASHLGEFAKQGDVEVFTPWTWTDGMYEVLHLFTTWMKSNYVSSTSDIDSTVSAYSSVNNTEDSMTVFLINRDLSQTIPADISIAGFVPVSGDVPVFQLKNLNGETFKGASDNALLSTTAKVANAAVSINLPPMSVTALVMKSQKHAYVNSSPLQQRQFRTWTGSHSLYIQPGQMSTRTASLYSLNGQLLRQWELTSGKDLYRLSLKGISDGAHWLRVGSVTRRVMVLP